MTICWVKSGFFFGFSFVLVLLSLVFCLLGFFFVFGGVFVVLFLFFILFKLNRLALERGMKIISLLVPPATGCGLVSH